MHDSSFWYQYSTVSPRGAREGTAPLGPPSDPPMAASMVVTGNSMGSSEIWDKYHSCCIGNGKFHSASPREIYPHFQYNTRDIYPKFHCYPCYY